MPGAAMSSLSQQATQKLAELSISVSPAKNDSEIEGALSADEFYRTIWPRIIDQNDKPHAVGNTEQMNDLNRDELKAHLENQNLKVDARLQSFEQIVKDGVGGVRYEMAEMRGELKVMHSELGSLKNIKGSIWGAAGATILGVGGIMAAMLSYGVANFDSGRETSQLIEVAKQQTLENKKLLDQIQAQVHAQKKIPEAALPPESPIK